jgi:uracil phosphoribosyltransferase
MKINNLSEHNCIINRYLAEMRDCDYQKNRLLFRNNIMRIGEYEAFEISKTLNYEKTEVTTPLGVAQVNLPTEKIVIGTIFRAGLPFHEGFLNIFDHSGNAFVSAYREYTNKEHTEVTTPLGVAQVNLPTEKIVIGTIFRAGLPFHEGFLNIFDHSGNAFVSAYREYTNKEHTEVGVHIEYLATPDLTDKVLIIADPMLATGISMEMGMKAFLTKGNPKHIHIACVLAAPEGIEHIKKTFPEDKTTIWCASIDEGLNEHKYIVPGFGDAGDLCYGSKL